MRAILPGALGLLLATTPAAADASSWRPPVPGRVARTFLLTPSAPFAAGQRRTLTFRAAPGAPVRAACAGRVTFAGRLPRGAGVTVACAGSGLRAGHTGLGTVVVAPGAAVVRGARLGTAGTAGRVALSARRGTRYLDPAGLLAPVVAPRGAPDATPRGGLPVRAGRPVGPGRAPAVVAEPVVAPVAPGLPAVGWAGLALLATGTGAGGVWRVRRRVGRSRAATVGT